MGLIITSRPLDSSTVRSADGDIYRRKQRGEQPCCALCMAPCVIVGYPDSCHHVMAAPTGLEFRLDICDRISVEKMTTVSGGDLQFNLRSKRRWNGGGGLVLPTYALRYK